ncbi:MAG: hypothetical protein IT572_11465 [Deltaproteobacteria bacterium]|nr:hypothetical protein [Deltaproteobacteria bacterium]
MKSAGLSFRRIFDFLDEVGAQTFARELNADEKAIAHSAVARAFGVARRESLPFAAAFEKTYAQLPALEEFRTLYELVRRQRGKLEKMLFQPFFTQGESL